MIEKITIKQSLYVRASFFTMDEIRRQARLSLNEIDENLVKDLTIQKEKLENQQNTILKSLIISIFLSFMSYNGGNIEVPGFGIMISEIPAFLEISLISSSFAILVISYTFLNIQIYTAVIQQISSTVIAKKLLDADLFCAAQTPTWLFFKYCRFSPVIGRPPTYVISKYGNIFYTILISSITLTLMLLWIFAIFSVVYLAQMGLSDSPAGWSVYIVCMFTIFAACMVMAANVLEFNHEMDLETAEDISIDT